MIRGFDYSKHQGTIDFKKARAAGMDFCYGKASEGITLVDPLYVQRMVQARAAGFVVGAYHFFHPKDDAVVQAHYFMNAAHMGIGSPVLLAGDFEWTEGHNEWDDYTLEECGEKVQDFLDEIQIMKRKIPFLYSAPAFISKYLVAVRTGTYKLWPAVYGKDIPAAYQNAAMWQRSESGTVDGIPGPVDIDIFPGTIQDLQALAAS